MPQRSPQPTLVYTNWNSNSTPKKPPMQRRAALPSGLPISSPLAWKLLRLGSLRPAALSAVELLIDDLLAELVPPDER